MSVGQEVGHARARNKFIVPLVEHGIPAAELGCLHGTTYMEFDPGNMSGAVEQVRRTVESRRTEVEKSTNSILAIGALLAILISVTK